MELISTKTLFPPHFSSRNNKMFDRNEQLHRSQLACPAKSVNAIKKVLKARGKIPSFGWKVGKTRY